MLQWPTLGFSEIWHQYSSNDQKCHVLFMSFSPLKSLVFPSKCYPLTLTATIPCLKTSLALLLSKTLQHFPPTSYNLFFLLYLYGAIYKCPFNHIFNLPKNLWWFPLTNLGQLLYNLDQRLANFFSKKPYSKYFQICEHTISVGNYSTPPPLLRKKSLV